MTVLREAGGLTIDLKCLSVASLDAINSGPRLKQLESPLIVVGYGSDLVVSLESEWESGSKAGVHLFAHTTFSLSKRILCASALLSESAIGSRVSGGRTRTSDVLPSRGGPCTKEDEEVPPTDCVSSA